MAAQQPAKQPVKVTIKHTAGNPPTIDKNRVKLSSSGKDEVEWQPDPADLKFVVCFEKDTPFSSWHFHPGQRQSGPPTVGARGEPYKYTIEVDGDRLDPEIKIDP